MFAQLWTLDEYSDRLSNVRSTLHSLEQSLIVSRNLEAEQGLRYMLAKLKNKCVIDDLRRANKHNRNMLNLFRQCVTDARLGLGVSLPESLRQEVQRSWHEKYDALLAKNEELRKELAAAEVTIKNKDKKIDELQGKLLHLGEIISERDATIKETLNKYRVMKKEKDVQDAFLRGFSKASESDSTVDGNQKDWQLSEIQKRNLLLQREIRRSDHLAHQNSRLKMLLREVRMSKNIESKES